MSVLTHVLNSSLDPFKHCWSRGHLVWHFARESGLWKIDPCETVTPAVKISARPVAQGNWKLSWAKEPGLGSSKVLVLGTWYLMQNLEYLVLTCTWHFEIRKYLVLTCTWRQSTWYLSKYFQVLLSNQHVYSGLNLEYVFFNKSPLNTIMINYWNGSYCVLTAWGLQTSRLDCLPWSAGQKYLWHSIAFECWRSQDLDDN